MKRTTYVCDICKEESHKAFESLRVERKDHAHGNYTVQVTWFNDTGSLDVCKYCLIKAVNSADDRPTVRISV